MKDIVIIPIREHSKGVRNKNILKFSNGLTSLEMISEVLSQLSNIDVYVNTESDLLSMFAESLGLEVIRRAKYLSDDKVTLDDVIENILENPILENYRNLWIIQATCPLISLDSLLKLKSELDSDKDIDTVFSAKNIKEFIWQNNEKQQKRLYKSRKNRQTLKNPYIAESGAVSITRIDKLKNTKNRFLKMNCKGVLIPEHENIDIDTHTDINLINMHLESQKGKLVFITNGNYEIGSGHIYRTINLASSSYPFSSIIFCKDSKLANEIFTKFEYDFVRYKEISEILINLKNYNIKALIIDNLETKYSDFRKFEKLNCPIVSMEDYGDDAFKNADIIINSLYETSIRNSNLYSGYKYESIRPDVLAFAAINKTLKGRKDLRKPKLLFCFGGTDPNKFMFRIPKILEILDEQLNQIIDVRLIYSINENNVIKFSNKVFNRINISSISHTSLIAKELQESDIVICGNGRMVYEATILDNFVLSIPQNSREATHTFNRDMPGNLQLPLHSLVTDKEIVNAIISMLVKLKNDYQDQKINSFRDKIKKDIILGTNRIIDLIRNV